MYPSLYGHKTYGRITQNAGTKIVRLIEPSRAAFTHLTYGEVIVAATAHILTVLKPLGVTTLSAAAAASQAVVNITADPGNYTNSAVSDNTIAGSDWAVIEQDDGTFVVDLVSSVSSLAITMTNNLTYAASAGNKFWFFGIETDTNPFDGLAHARFTLSASGRTYFGDAAGESNVPWFSSNRREEPIVLVIDNGSNASTLERVTAAYSTKTGQRALSRQTHAVQPA